MKKRKKKDMVNHVDEIMTKKEFMFLLRIGPICGKS
jgi:hypothetical protein